MSTTPVTLLKAVPTGLDQWLDTHDPQGIVSKSQCSLLTGYYDADKDSVRDDSEGIFFFREFLGKDGQVYVLTLTPRANSGGSGSSPMIDVQFFRKDADGVLSAPPASLLAGLNLYPAGLTLSVESLQSLTQSVQTWCGNLVSPSSANLSNISKDTGGYDNHYRQHYFKLDDDDFFDIEGQGSVNNRSGSIGGWGGGYVYADWCEYQDCRKVTAHEAYEWALGGQVIESGYHDMPEDPRRPVVRDNWARDNGLTIVRLNVVVDGVSRTTMGFQTTQNGLTYTFYWDQAAQCNRIGQVTNAAGVNVTNQVLALQADNKFGKSWNEIRNTVNWVKEIRSPGGLSSYSADLFSVDSKTGSAEVSTAQETAALNAFLLKWADYITGARIKRLPDTNDKRAEMLDELLKLNPGDLMRLFTGTPGASGASPDGLQLLNQLIQSSSLTMSQAQTLSESLGKIMYLTGRELARNGAQNSSEALAKVSFFKGIQTQVSGLINTLSERVTASGFDQSSLRKILYHFMLGLQNFTDGKVWASGLTPEATLTYLVQKLVEAGDINKPEFTRNAAIVIGEFGRSVIGMLGILQGLQLVESIPVNEDRGNYFAGLISIVAGSGSQDSTQRLLAQYFGMLASHANQSPEAAKQFTDMQQSAHEDSRKLQDAIVALLMRFLDLLRDSTNRAFSRN